MLLQKRPISFCAVRNAYIEGVGIVFFDRRNFLFQTLKKSAFPVFRGLTDIEGMQTFASRIVNSISMPKGHGIALTPLKGAKLSFIEGKLES